MQKGGKITEEMRILLAKNEYGTLDRAGEWRSSTEYQSKIFASEHLIHKVPSIGKKSFLCKRFYSRVKKVGFVLS